MSRPDAKLSRRNFIHLLGVAVALPLFASPVLAQETTASVAGTVPDTANKHRIVTANILASLSEHDGTPVDWETSRGEVCVKVIKDQDADIVCLQEVLRSQYELFQKSFPGYEFFGYEGPYMDTAPNRFQGIKNVIMFSRDRYELTSAGNYWLSDTPLIEGSTAWGEKLGRHVNWVRLKDKSSGRQFRVLNTHFAVRNLTHQQESVDIINAEADQYTDSFPQLLAGDFNANDATPTIKRLKDAGWIDTFEAVHGETDAGYTFHGFKRTEPEPDARDVQIDWIFYRGKVKPVGAKVIWDNVNGIFPSDHLFVSTDVVIGG